MAVAPHALTQRSKGQGHTVMKTTTVTWLPYAAAGVGCTCRTSFLDYDDCLL